MARKYDDDDDEQGVDEEDDDRESSRKRKRGGLTDSEKQMAMFCHLGNIIGGVIIPLVLWLTQKDKSDFIDKHGKEALNFGITMMIGHFLGICTFGILNMILIVLAIVFSIQAGMAASRGENYEYSMCIRFIK